MGTSVTCSSSVADQWPEEIADAVKAIKHTPFGPTIVTYDKLRARELMAIAGRHLVREFRLTLDHHVQHLLHLEQRLCWHLLRSRASTKLLRDERQLERSALYRQRQQQFADV